MDLLKSLFYFACVPCFMPILLLAEILNIFSLLDRKKIEKIEKLMEKTLPFDSDSTPDDEKRASILNLITRKELFVLNNNITKEDSDYSKMLETIEKPIFHKIKNYCKFLVKTGEADNMQKALANYRKGCKIAPVYTFLEEYKDKTFNIIDIGSDQGILAMWILECMRMLNIMVNKIILINDDELVLSRATMHLETLKDKDTLIIPLNLYLDDLTINDFHYESDSSYAESLFVEFKDNEIQYKISSNSSKISIYHETTINFKNIKDRNYNFDYNLEISKSKQYIHIAPTPKNFDVDDIPF